MTTGKDIPREVAVKLCDEIRAENKRKWFSLGRLQCWGCYTWARGDMEKLCLSSKEGCNLVNNQYKLRQGYK